MIHLLLLCYYSVCIWSNKYTRSSLGLDEMEQRHWKSGLDTNTNLKNRDSSRTYLNWMFSTGASVKSDTHSILRICWTWAPPSMTGSTGLACTFSCGDGSQGHNKDTCRRGRLLNKTVSTIGSFFRVRQQGTVDWRGYESWVFPGWRQTRWSSGTGWTSCCRRTHTCDLRERETVRTFQGINMINFTSVELESGLPRFCRYSDLSPICRSWFSKMTPLFLQTNLKQQEELFWLAKLILHSFCWRPTLWTLLYKTSSKMICNINNIHLFI